MIPSSTFRQVGQLSLQGGLVLSKRARLEWETIFCGHIFNHCDVIGQQSYRKIRAITPFNVIQDHRGRYQSNARMRLPISV